jgi:subtilisin family serine protease
MEYVILRDLNRAHQRDSVSGGTRGLESSEPSGESLSKLRIDVEDIDANGVHEIARESTTVTLEPSMPTVLIKPFDDDTGQDAKGDAWGIEAVRATESSYTGRGALVAVLDTGIDANHPAFAGVNIVQQDFTDDGNGDVHGHGTHCAGTIVGRDVGGERIGVARGVQRILIGKILDDSGAGTTQMALDGLLWAAREGAHVASMSLGLDFTGTVSLLVDQGWPVNIATSFALDSYRGSIRLFDKLMELVKEQTKESHGCIVIAAAGNQSERNVNPDYKVSAALPAAAEGVLSIGAVGQSPNGYSIAPFSNSRPKLCAPGVEIKSARAGGGLCTKSGTSMAGPHAAGVAALWWEQVRTLGFPLTAESVAARMITACRLDELDPDADAGDRGNGLITAPQ